MHTILSAADRLATLVVIFAAIGFCLSAAGYFRSNGTVHVNTLYQAGARLELEGVDWASHEKTLVLAVSPSCHFCSDGAAFYRRITDAASRVSAIHIMVVLAEPAGEGKRYLQSLQVPIADVRQVNMSAARIPVTPLLMLVGSNGTVENSWAGKLSAAQESDVLSQFNDRAAARLATVGSPGTELEFAL